jgi:hypothetical protein
MNTFSNWSLAITFIHHKHYEFRFYSQQSACIFHLIFHNLVAVILSGWR